ncbi:MAG: hypothetical protein ACM3MG_11115 [Bacillota bacterium]
MKKILAIAATLAASSAFAGVKLEVRSDYVNTPDYKNALGVEGYGSSLFTPSVARLYLNGNVGEAVVESGWNLRAFTPEAATNPYTNGTEVYKNMTVDKFVDHLWAGKAMGDWMFKAGKLEVNTGGFEHIKTLHGDTYLVSLANGGTGGVLGTPAPGTAPIMGEVVTPENSSGVSAAYSITPNHKLEVQATNQTNSQTVSGTTKSTDRQHTTGLNYTGSVLDKMLAFNAGYIAGSGDTNTTGHQLELINAGIRVAPMADLTIDLEYFANKDKQTTTTTSADVKTTSTIIEARYNMNGWTPVLKYETSKNEGATSATDFKRDAYAVALEYAPKADEAFRYHVAWTSTKDKDFGTANLDDVTKNMIIVGIKYTGDMTK